MHDMLVFLFIRFAIESTSCILSKHNIIVIMLHATFVHTVGERVMTAGRTTSSTEL